MLFWRSRTKVFKKSPEGENRSPERPQPDLSNVLASLLMRLERVEHRLDALEPRSPFPKPPEVPGPRAQEVASPPTQPEPPSEVPKELKVEKPKPREPKSPLKVKRLGAKPRKAERVRLEKLEPVKLTRGKSIRPFAGEKE